jgi:hypothetical protein
MSKSFNLRIHFNKLLINNVDKIKITFSKASVIYRNYHNKVKQKGHMLIEKLKIFILNNVDLIKMKDNKRMNLL